MTRTGLPWGLCAHLPQHHPLRHGKVTQVVLEKMTAHWCPEPEKRALYPQRCTRLCRDLYPQRRTWPCRALYPQRCTEPPPRTVSPAPHTALPCPLASGSDQTREDQLFPVLVYPSSGGSVTPLFAGSSCSLCCVHLASGPPAEDQGDLICSVPVFTQHSVCFGPSRRGSLTVFSPLHVLASSVTG